MLQKCSAEKNNHAFYINYVTLPTLFVKDSTSDGNTIEKDKERNDTVINLLFCSV